MNRHVYYPHFSIVELPRFGMRLYTTRSGESGEHNDISTSNVGRTTVDFPQGIRAGVRPVPPSGRRLPLRRARGARWARGALVKAVWSRDTRIDGGRMRERRTQLKLRRTGGAILQRNAAQHRCARSHSEDGGSGNPFAFSRGGQAEFLLISGQQVGHV